MPWLIYSREALFFFFTSTQGKEMLEQNFERVDRFCFGAPITGQLGLILGRIICCHTNFLEFDDKQFTFLHVNLFNLLTEITLKQKYCELEILKKINLDQPITTYQNHLASSTCCKRYLDCVQNVPNLKVHSLC